jgi:hypothetical protein
VIEVAVRATETHNPDGSVSYHVTRADWFAASGTHCLPGEKELILPVHMSISIRPYVQTTYMGMFEGWLTEKTDGSWTASVERPVYGLMGHYLDKYHDVSDSGIGLYHVYAEDDAPIDCRIRFVDDFSEAYGWANMLTLTFKNNRSRRNHSCDDTQVAVLTMESDKDYGLKPISYFERC